MQIAVGKYLEVTYDEYARGGGGGAFGRDGTDASAGGGGGRRDGCSADGVEA